MLRSKLTVFLDDYLSIEMFNDLCPNGLQVEGKKKIKKIVTAVSASIELFEKAIEEKADTIIVHHGIIWNFERPVFKSSYRKRLQLLFDNEINLLAYHLPLDANKSIGNNALLCRELGVKNVEPFGDDKGQYIGLRGSVENIPKRKFFSIIEDRLKRKPTIFPFGPERINSVGIISGAAQKKITQAVAAGLDAFITGEVSEHIMHYAKEENIHFISAGHYTTEIFGIRALGNLIADKFKLNVKFIDIPNPV